MTSAGQVRRYWAAGHQLDKGDGGHCEHEGHKGGQRYAAPSKVAPSLSQSCHRRLNTGLSGRGKRPRGRRSVKARATRSGGGMNLGAHPAKRVRVEGRGHGGDHTDEGGSGKGPGYTEEGGDDRSGQSGKSARQDLNNAHALPWLVSYRRRVRHRLLLDHVALDSRHRSLLGSSANAFTPSKGPDDRSSPGSDPFVRGKDHSRHLDE